MSHWNYRVCKELFKYNEPIDGKEGEIGFSFREVYYTDDNKIWTVSKEPCAPFGETETELLEDIERMRKSVEKGVIDLDTIKFADSPYESTEDKLIQAIKKDESEQENL